MATEKEIRSIEQFVDGSPAQPSNDLALIRRQEPEGSGNYEWYNLPLSSIMGGITGNTRLTEFFPGSNLVAGTYYLFGSYNAPAADANLTNASATVTYGGAQSMYGAYVFIVASGAGSTDAGTVELEVSGTSIDDVGNRTPADTEVIVVDIAALEVVANVYLQTLKKWVGTVTFTLQGASGSPTTFSFDFNYGFTTYETGGGSGFTLDLIDVKGFCGVDNSTGNFDIGFLLHPNNGDTTMTYSAAAFVPGGDEIYKITDTVATDNFLTQGHYFAVRRESLNFPVGTSTLTGRGVVCRITTGTNDTVDYMNVTLGIK